MDKMSEMTNAMVERIAETVRFLKTELNKYSNPVLNVSFGKDSLCLLHLMGSHGIRPSLVSYMHPYYPRKYRWQRELIAKFDLSVFNYPPREISMMYGKTGEPALMEAFQTSQSSTIGVPVDILEYRDGDPFPGKYRCGVDLLTRPLSLFSYPWDVAIIGHKDCDSDTIYGDVPLASRVLYRDVGPDCLFPLKTWSHDDVWDYLSFFQIEVQPDRYNQAAREEWEDKTHNPDWYEACIRCVDKRRAGTKVYCPKLKVEIPNVSAEVAEFTQKFDYFGST